MAKTKEQPTKAPPAKTPSPPAPLPEGEGSQEKSQNSDLPLSPGERGPGGEGAFAVFAVRVSAAVAVRHGKRRRAGLVFTRQWTYLDAVPDAVEADRHLEVKTLDELPEGARLVEASSPSPSGRGGRGVRVPSEEPAP